MLRAAILMGIADCITYMLAIFLIDATLAKSKEVRQRVSLWAAAVCIFFITASTGYYLSYAVFPQNLAMLGDAISAIAIILSSFTAIFTCYKEHKATKIFVSISACFISILLTFVSGTLLTALHVSADPFSIQFFLAFYAAKIPIKSVFYLLYHKMIKNSAKEVISILDGKMDRYIPVPVVGIIAFFIVSTVTGLTPADGVGFALLYISIITIFTLMYWLIFSGAIWTSKALKTQTELGVAHQIQNDLLPCIFPAFPERPSFDIYATMEPAKDIGGDFYDFFLIDDSKLCFLISDVSGKGIPAALFMVVAKTVIKNYAQMGMSAKDIFENSNSTLCENNNVGMFVTSFLAIIDMNTGHMSYVNAGHNPPVLKRSNEEFKWLKSHENFVLAGLEGIPYESQSIDLLPGDIVFMYTDGITEAVNPKLELYSEPKLLDTLNYISDAEGKSPQDIIACIRESVERFAAGAEQADDITMLCFKYFGEQKNGGKANG